MRLPLRLMSIVLAAVVAACVGAAPAPTAAPSPGLGGSAYWLRLMTAQAIAPVDRFAVGPTAIAADADGYVTAGPVEAIFPGPLLPSLVTRPISADGRATIVAEAGRLGLLGGQRDLLGGAGMPGGITGTIELVVDGQLVTLTGDPMAQIQCVITPCEPPPGTPAAFGELWRRLAEPSTWIARALGPERPYVARAYALLVGPAPLPDAGLGPRIGDWPLDIAPGAFGRAVAAGYRCGIVRGADADALRPALESADQLTQWVMDPSMSATFGLAVRPIVADEDPCGEAFGPG